MAKKVKRGNGKFVIPREIMDNPVEIERLATEIADKSRQKDGFVGFDYCAYLFPWGERRIIRADRVVSHVVEYLQSKMPARKVSHSQTA